MSPAGSQGLLMETSACSGQSGEKAILPRAHITRGPLAQTTILCLDLLQGPISKYLKSEISTSGKIPNLQS